MSGKHVVVLGAGVAGLSTALYLRREGLSVTVLDPLPPGSGASFGNAGMISPDSVVPIALPGMLRKVPHWLLDPMGPLRVNTRHLPRALPWLLRWIRCGTMPRATRTSDALAALHRHSFACWAELLGPSGMDEFIRRQGQIHVWESHRVSAAEQAERRLRERHGVRSQVLDAQQLRRMFPGIANSVVRGLLLPDNGHTIDSSRLVQRLGELLRAAGGRIVAERALKLVPTESGRWTVLSHVDNHAADSVVVATGAAAPDLLRPLRLRLPLAAERGYHIALCDARLHLERPIVFKSRGVAMSPNGGGLRVSGTVEIDAHDAPPDERRARYLENHLRQAFPDAGGAISRLWMGSRPSTPDSLPLLGAVAAHPGLFLCVGHGHFGMTGGPPSGRLVAAAITGRPPIVDPTPYSITRPGR